MNFSPRQGGGKWRFGAAGGRGALVTAVTLACLLGAQPDPAQGHRHAGFGFEDLFGPPPHRTRRATAAVPLSNVPLPKPRPAEAPRGETEQAKGEPEIAPSIAPPAKPAEPTEQRAPAPASASAPPVAPQPSACRQALTEEIAVAPSIPPIHGPGGCGGDDLVRLEAVVLPDKRRVAVTPAATLRCTMATSIADWVRSDVAPLTETLGSEIAELDNFDSFECRGRNRVKGAPLSEHGKANALDVRGFKLADGRSIGLTDRNQPRSLREDLLHSACRRFMTVLGPDSDWYHEDHIHLDQMERHNNYKICQWDVLDPLPQVAPLMPEERPADAPPREVAKGEGAQDEGANDEAAKEAPAVEGDKQEELKPAAAAAQKQPASTSHRSAKSSKTKRE